MATLVLVLNLCGLPRRALAAPAPAPVQNLTAPRTDIASPWVSGPDNRGTWSLLCSCVLTLVLCVWTAVHLNVPSYNESHLSQWLRKLKWVLLAIMAPELGAYTACEQYFQAKKLIRQLGEISVNNGSQSYHTNRTQLPQKSQEPDPEKAASRRRVFSLIYGYFAVMGGLAVDVSDIDDRLHTVTLTPAALRLLAEKGHFLEVSDGDIRDKSKADIFAKCLVILQVTWIALQSISRKATGYPLSPLEIHILVHAACATVMYILWFQKPLDVQAPTIVSKASFEDLIALMLTQTPRLGRTWYSHLDPPKDFKSFLNGDKPLFRGSTSEASFLMFDDSALSRRDEGCSSCSRHSFPSTRTNGEVADKGVLHAIHKTCDSCVNLSQSERRQAEISEAHTLSSPITSHPPAGIRCGPPPGVKAVCDLRSGDFTAQGIGLQPLMTGRSNHDSYVPRSCCGLWKFFNPCPSQQALPAQISRALKERLPESLPGQREPAYWHEINLSLSEKDCKRWKLAGCAFLKEIEVQGLFDPRKPIGRYRPFEMTRLLFQDSGNFRSINGWPWYGRLLAWRCRNANGKFLGEGSGTLLLTLGLLTSLYSGIHLALWNYDFPTPQESLLWKISAVTLASGSVLLVLLLIFLVTAAILIGLLQKIFPGFCSQVRYTWRSWGGDEIMHGAYVITLISSGPVVMLYVFARVFIVVESFISLRHVPVGVYEGGFGWSQYVPHL